MADLITKIIGSGSSWFVVKYDPDYLTDSPCIIRNPTTDTGDYPTKEAAQATLN